MPIIKWSDNFKVNVQELDDHHKRLAEIVNEFDESLHTNKGEKVLYKLLDDLLTETSSHFIREESIMKLYKYPDHDIHKEEHNILSKEITNMFKGYSTNDRDKSIKIAIFLENWLMDHIVKEDKKLGEYLNSKGIT